MDQRKEEGDRERGCKRISIIIIIINNDKVNDDDRLRMPD